MVYIGRNQYMMNLTASSWVLVSWHKLQAVVFIVVFLVEVDYAPPLLFGGHGTSALAIPFCLRSYTSIWRVMGCYSERISCSALCEF